MDEETINKTNVAKLLPRFLKKGDQTVRELSQKILDNAAASTKRKREAAKSTPKEGSVHKSSSALGGMAANGVRTELAGTKRPTDSETNSLPATKRVAQPPAKPNTKPGNASGGAPPAKRQHHRPQAYEPLW